MNAREQYIRRLEGLWCDSTEQVEPRVLKNGEHLVVSMAMMDEGQREVSVLSKSSGRRDLCYTGREHVDDQTPYDQYCARLEDAWRAEE